MLTAGALVSVVCDLVELACELAQLRGGEQSAEAGEAVDLGQALAILAVQEQRGQVEGVRGVSSGGRHVEMACLAILSTSIPIPPVETSVSAAIFSSAWRAVAS